MTSPCWMSRVVGAKAWRGETLARETSWIARLTDAEIADVEQALAAAKASGKPLEAITRDDFPLTAMRPRLEQALADMYDGRGFVVLRGLLYNGFYYIRREAALTERGVSDKPIPVFGARDGVVSCRYIRNQINAGAVKRGVPLTTLEQAALDYLDECTRRPDLRLDMDL